MKYLEDVNEDKAREENVDMDRRKALAKLGIMAVAAYAAPLLLKISDAHAKGGSGGSGGSGGGSGGGSRGDSGGGSRGSGASGASGGTGASSSSGATGASGPSSSSGATGATGASGQLVRAVPAALPVPPEPAARIFPPAKVADAAEVEVVAEGVAEAVDRIRLI